MFNTKTILAAAMAGFFTGSVNADVLYSDGVLDGNTTALQISSGYAVADTFNLAANSTVTGVTFDSWDGYSNDVTNVDWSIISANGAGASSPTGGVVIASGVQTAVSGATLFTNTSGSVVEANTFSLPNVSLAGGTYWLELSNALTASGADVYWDVNSNGSNPGASNAWTNVTGTFSPSNTCGTYIAGMGSACSNTFQVVGAVPLPGAVWLFVSGIAGIFATGRLTRKD
ncbi:MAG: hypothetical protein ABSB19_03560 [Methylomonas sp.]|jgi:hypothetical protein